jgi:hypothetical protein
VFSGAELAAVWEFVKAGGGLVVVTENEHDKYGDNLNELLAPMGLRIENGVAFDRTACVSENPEWVLGQPAAGSALGYRASRAGFYRAGWVSAEAPAEIAWRTSPQAFPADAGLIATATFGAGRVVVVCDSNLFGDDRFGAFDHRQLWLNLVYWCAAPVFAKGPAAAGQASREAASPSAGTASPVDSACWRELKASVNRLRQLQEPDGRVPAEKRETASGLVDSAMAALAELRPCFPHQTEYLELVTSGLRAWVAGGFEKPDFAAALAAFRPEQQRRDGLEHLVIFPMYTPNASSETRFEALLVRTPWPAWLDAIERGRFRNPKFVPGHLVDFTDGYASECAVLFPETVSIAGPPSNHFGVIFCDREARRLQTCARRAAEATRRRCGT